MQRSRMKHKYAIYICKRGIGSIYSWKCAVLDLWGVEFNNAEKERTKKSQQVKIGKARKARQEEKDVKNKKGKEAGWLAQMFEAFQAR